MDERYWTNHEKRRSIQDPRASLPNVQLSHPDLVNSYQRTWRPRMDNNPKLWGWLSKMHLDVLQWAPEKYRGVYAHIAERFRTRFRFSPHMSWELSREVCEKWTSKKTTCVSRHKDSSGDSVNHYLVNTYEDRLPVILVCRNNVPQTILRVDQNVMFEGKEVQNVNWRSWIYSKGLGYRLKTLSDEAIEEQHKKLKEEYKDVFEIEGILERFRHPRYKEYSERTGKLYNKAFKPGSPQMP